MSRPLVVTDCDEVLLHMVRHFRQWLDEEHDVEFRLQGDPFVQSIRRRGSDEPVNEEDVYRYLGLFFDTEMPRQTLVEGAAEAIGELRREADVVVLTNLTDERNTMRRDQLLEFGIDARVYTNQGPKGEALRRIYEEYRPTRAVFIDDLAVHHASAAEILPDARRLHFCAEPAIARHIPCAFTAGHAHARIDSWDEALPWLLETLHGKPS